MYCPECGRQIPEGGSFCPYCGTPAGGNPAGGDETLAEEPEKTVHFGRFQLTGEKGKLRILIFAAAAFVVVVVLLLVFRSPAATMKRQMDIGSRYLEEGDFEQAVMAYKEALDIDPTAGEAYIGLAKAYAGSKDHENEILILRTGIEKAADGDDRTLLQTMMTDSLDQLVAEAKDLFRSGDTDGAEALYELVLSADPERGEVYSGLADIDEAGSNIQKAVTDLNRGVTALQDNDDAESKQWVEKFEDRIAGYEDTQEAEERTSPEESEEKSTEETTEASTEEETEEETTVDPDRALLSELKLEEDQYGVLAQDVRQTYTDVTMDDPKYAQFPGDGIAGAKILDLNEDGDDELVLVRLSEDSGESHGSLLNVILDVFEADENGEVTLSDSRTLLQRPMTESSYLMNLQLIRTEEGVDIFLELHEIFMLYGDAHGEDYLAWRYEDETIQPAFLYACDIDDIDGESELQGSDGFVFTGTEYENGAAADQAVYYAQYEDYGGPALYGDDFVGAIRAFLTERHGIRIDVNGLDYDSGRYEGSYLTSDNDMETLCTVNMMSSNVYNTDYSRFDRITFERTIDRDFDLFPKEKVQDL